MRTIDADRAKEEFCGRCHFKYANSCGGCRFFGFIDKQPTVDLVKHGHWAEWDGMIPVGLEGKHHCSVCGSMAPYDAGFREMLTDWCHGCGARMDERPIKKR